MFPDRAFRFPQQPQSQPGGKTERRIEAAIEFSESLYRILSSDPKDAPATDALVNDIKKHVDRLHECQQKHKYLPGVTGDPEVDTQAVRLWNLCTRLRRGKFEAERLRRLFLYGKVLAFHLLAVVRPPKQWASGEVVYLLRLALKAARDCIDGSESELATPILTKAAEYKGVLQDLTPRLAQEDVDEANCLEVEYFIVRTALSWKENRIDVAEHMYTKAERLRNFLTPDYAERLADILYKIGKSLSAKGDFAIAIKWLERADETVNRQSLESPSREGIELRLAILQALVSALLKTGATKDLERAKNYVDCIEAEVGNKLVVSLLRLELLQKTPAEVFDSDAYSIVLRHMIKDFNFTEPGFKLIIYHIRKLHDKSPGSGCTVLDDFILALSKAENDIWVEKAIVSRIWMTSNQRDTLATIDAVRSVLSNLTKPLSAEAAIAAQVLESNYALGQYDLAESWCQLSLHTAFQSCGPNNTSKLERKLLLCALARDSLEVAVSIIQKMSQQSWNEPMTAYLAFKVAVRTKDRVLAERSLETVSSTPDHMDYLGACIAESQNAGDIFCAIAALNKLYEKYEYKAPNLVHLPALFRCTIRLLHLLVGRPDADKNLIVHKLCEGFDAVVLALQKQKQDAESRDLFSVDELEWFSRNAYNLALKNTITWDLRYVVKMLTACVNIVSYFPSDVGSQVDLSLKSLFSRFVISSALVSLARTQDNVEKQRHDYRAMRTHVMEFDKELPEHLPHFDKGSKEDMLRKHAALLAFDFEAAMSLGQLEDLGNIVQRAALCRNVTAYQAMADCLLRGKVPAQVLYSTMRKIINEIWSLESFDALKLAKYTRCLFQATLPLDDGLGIKLLDEACSQARELRESEGHWPEEELQWMAATAFNHAIDCYSSHETERAEEWATKAINLSHYCNDEGGLERTLQEKYLQLKFDVDAR
ncbi:meiosis protein SPO22/ZIP4 like-domain-containing protein [Lasiosphaeris hirsuta]|uniref:Meiosis protein SPO22/ZIP4 like-domain-containing protein n=1 Tax=Lasiosphaeris hirsuta TaxID=260670 RepID=A0AA40DKQ6_9PEZI|nr:meiosis protein SPO22/ZIP4 like-domain-containing protein [Lasiosphaeris hirsuta]